MYENSLFEVWEVCISNTVGVMAFFDIELAEQAKFDQEGEGNVVELRREDVYLTEYDLAEIEENGYVWL
tara:strand:- start:1320 stop:1526 length:207 start_codon:yes stop_codon:yes gene_type:complete